MKLGILYHNFLILSHLSKDGVRRERRTTKKGRAKSPPFSKVVPGVTSTLVFRNTFFFGFGFNFLKREFFRLDR